jgi:short-subunit dehydrogenase
VSPAPGAGEPPLALVTGASSGIGRELAAALARRGHALCLVGRDATRLAEVAAALPLSPRARAEVLVADLALAADRERVAARLRQPSRPVSVLVNAAGLGTARGFPDASLDGERAMLEVNVHAVLELSATAATAMRERGSGIVLNVGSTAAVWSRGTYAGSKAWVHAVTTGLAQTCAGTGVTATLLVPGFTRTDFHRRSGTEASRVARWLWLDARAVAEEGVVAALAGRAVCVPSRRYRVLVATMGRLPAPARARFLGWVAPLAPARDPGR